MKLHNSILRTTAPVILAAALFAARAAQAVVTFSVTPAAVSNTYNGYITLQINGLTSGQGVVIQKYLDCNTNGAVDAGDLLVEQGNLVDGKVSTVIGGVTNFNVPGDSDGATNGAITANFNFNNGDFIQGTVGKYLWVLSSTNGAFTPITNAFSVTNLPYAQQMTGTVQAQGAVVTNALVILFPPPRPGGDHGPGTPVGAVVANNSGVYTIKLPVGTYVPLAFRSNYVGNFSAAPVLNLSSGQTLSSNLFLTNATTSVSGSYVDSTNSSRGLAGVFAPLTTSSGLITGGFTDTNGNFNVPVTAGQSWSLGGNASALIIHGYVGYDNNPTNANSGASGVTIGFPRATSLFYGKILDNLGNPIPGIAIEAFDQNNNIYQQDGYADTNGNYVTAAVGGLGSNDPWTVNVDQNPTNYVFSQPAIQQNGGTNIAVGQAVQANFTGIAVTGAITGNIKYNGSNVVGVGVNANATINSVQYQPNTAHTDSNGNYTLYVANGTWGVNLNCNGGDDSLNNILNGSFECPSSTNVTINNNTGTANFTIQACAGAQIYTTSLPSGQVNSFYDFFLQGATCNGNQDWSLNDPQDFPGSLNFNSNGEISGIPDSPGTYNFSVNLSDDNGNSMNQSLSLTIIPAVPPLQVATVSLPNGTNGTFYSTTLQATGGQSPYSWSLEPGSANLPANLSLGTNGVISGTPVVSGTNLQFIVQVTDSNNNIADQTLALTITGVPLQVTTASLPNGTNGVFYSAALQASGGHSPYSWSLAAGSANLPANLTLGTNGVISGTPVVSGTNLQFIAQVTDASNNIADQTLALTITGVAAPLQVTTASLPNGTNGLAYNATLAASGGQPPYTWSLAPGSASLPANLALGTNGMISGTAAVSGTNLQFIAEVTDSALNNAERVLSLTLAGSTNTVRVSLALVRPVANGTLQFTFTSANGVNYAVQSSPDVKTWTTVLSFTGSGETETISAPTTGGGKATYYRVKIGP